MESDGDRCSTVEREEPAPHELATRHRNRARQPISQLRRHAWAIPLEVIILINLVVTLMQDDWAKAVIPPLLLLAASLPLFVERWAKVAIPGWLHFFYVAFLFAGPFAGSQLGFYGTWSPWDSVVHTASGILVGCSVIFALQQVADRYLLLLPAWFKVATMVTTGGFVAGFWEILEYTSDHVLGTSAQNGSLTDTMTDIICGMTGASLVGAVLLMHHLVIERRVVRAER